MTLQRMEQKRGEEKEIFFKISILSLLIDTGSGNTVLECEEKTMQASLKQVHDLLSGAHSFVEIN